MAQEKPLRRASKPIQRQGVGPHSKLMPAFVPPPLPRCAFGDIPEHRQKVEKQAKYRRWKLRTEELKELDFHGCGGNVAGLRAFLAHKYSGSVRGWRIAFAPDPLGIQPVTFQEFNIALKKVGYQGNGLTLWREISKPACTIAGLGPAGRTASLEDFEPSLVKHLDAVSKGLFEKYKKGGVFAWWPDAEKEHAGRMTFPEFETFILENELVSHEAKRDRLFVDVRRVFEAMDMAHRCTLTRDDLRFLDHWASRRFGRALPEEEPRDSVESEPWSPPPKAAEPLHDLEEFRDYLTRHFGTPARAWRMMLDVKGDGVLNASDFGKGCRAAGWHHPHHPLFLELKQEKRRPTVRDRVEIIHKGHSSKGVLGSMDVIAIDHGDMSEFPYQLKNTDDWFKEEWVRLPTKAQGSVSLRALDPETAGAIDELIAEVFPRFGDIYNFWTELLDPGGTGTVSQTEFVAHVRRELDISADRLARIFSCLDTANTGWVAVTEIGFLEAFEGSQSAMYSSQTSQSQPGLRLPALHASTDSFGSSRLRSPDTGTGFRNASAGGRSAFSSTSPGLGRSASWSDGGVSHMTSLHGASSDELKRSVGDKMTRSAQRNAYSQSYMIKHRWLRTSALERIAHCSKGVEKTRLPKKTGESDIFRTTNEFYREGVQMLKDHYLTENSGRDVEPDEE